MLQSKLILQTNPVQIASFQSLRLGKMNKQFMRKDPTEPGRAEISSSPVPARPGISYQINGRQISYRSIKCSVFCHCSQASKQLVPAQSRPQGSQRGRCLGGAVAGGNATHPGKTHIAPLVFLLLECWSSCQSSQCHFQQEILSLGIDFNIKTSKISLLCL